jgi:ComF family protein
VLTSAVKPKLAQILRGCFSLLFPDDCRICQSPLTEISRVPVCAKCLHEAPVPFEAEHFCNTCGLPFLTAAPLDEEGRCPMCRLGLMGFDAAYCYASYEGTLRELIHLFKYGRVATLSAPLGRRLAGALPREGRFDVIVPMPMHWLRRWRRGFNQAELLAREIGKRTCLPVAGAVKRTRATAPQAGLSNAKRRKNVAAAFAPGRQAGAISGKRVLLVDDVMTTGSTASACAAVLKKAGAAHVAVLTLARVDRRWNSLAVPAGLPDRPSFDWSFADGNTGSNASTGARVEREL